MSRHTNLPLSWGGIKRPPEVSREVLECGKFPLGSFMCGENDENPFVSGLFLDALVAIAVATLEEWSQPVWFSSASSDLNNYEASGSSIIGSIDFSPASDFCRCNELVWLLYIPTPFVSFQIAK